MRKHAHSSRELVSSVHRQAEERAADAARRVPWRVLLETRDQYLEWQEFYYWARSIIESEGKIPEWLEKRLDEVCPGFLAAEKDKAARGAKEWKFAD